MSTDSHRENPFKGLQPFEQEDEGRLFGRERDLILIKDRILSSRTTLLFAGSGVGKTSFLNAAVIPELSKRYCVVWHNRWTGADDRSDADLLDDRPPFKLWPPRAFAAWLTDVVLERFWLRRKMESQSEIETKKAAKVQERFLGDVQNVISQSLKPGNETRLSSVLSVFKKEARRELPSEVRKKGCMLILDQFEEVFQYHAYQDYFDDFLSDLCAVINDEEYQVRVVFSMREEFLGELSAFDNLIPDLFSNYYRLRYPKTEEAKHIITETCRWVNVEPHPENLDKLVKDLSTFETSNTAEAGAPPVRVMHRDFVPPPYLQIVCDSLWKEQYNSAATSVAGENGGTQKEIGRFLENYKTVSEKPVEGAESDAQRAVREFCEAKLSPPFLNKWEQNVASRAFEFLVTKQGAKMAYELRSLASHMEERAWALKHTLQKLSRPNARILRESRGPEGSYWFELYHDMYAGVVDRWKRAFRREKRRQQRRHAIAFAAGIAFLILIPLAVINWIDRPRQYSQTITDFRDNLQAPEILTDDKYGSALAAYSQLKDTLFYEGRARLLWSEVWQRRAQLYEAREQPEEALLCLLQAAALAKGYAEEKQYISQANNLIAGDEDSIKATYCVDCKFASLSPNARYLLTVSNSGQVNTWDTTQPSQSATTLCTTCAQALFGADGNSVVTVAPIERPLYQINRPRQGERIEQNPDAASAASPSPSPGTDQKTNEVIGWRIAISSIFSTQPSATFEISAPRNDSGETANKEAKSPEFLLRAAGKTDFGYLVAAFVDKKLTIWRENGSVFIDSVPGVADLEHPRFARVLVSPDGRLLSVGTLDLATNVWAISQNGLLPFTLITNLSKSHLQAFSADGRYYLSAIADGDVKLWDLSEQREVLLIDLATDELSLLGFAAGSSKFFVASGENTIAVWDSDTRKRLYDPVKIARDFESITLDAEGKHVVLHGTDREVTKWSVETGKQVGELTIGHGDDPANIASVLTSNGSVVSLALDRFDIRLWDIPNPKVRFIFGESRESGSLSGILSKDGLSIFTISYDSSKPPTYQLWDVSSKTQISSFTLPMRPFSYSPDNSRVAFRRGDNEIEIFDTRNPNAPGKIVFEDKVGWMDFSPDSSLLAVTTGNEVKLVEVSSNVITKSIKPDLNASWLQFAPSGQYLLISASPPAMFAIEMWSVTGGERIALNLDSKDPIQTVAFSGNDRLLVVQGNRVEVRNLSDGTRVGEAFNAEKISLAQFSPDGNLVVITDTKGDLQLYEVSSGKRLSTVTIGSPATSIIFSEDGSSLVAVTSSWIHRLTIANKTLRYADGIFAGDLSYQSVRQLRSTAEATYRYLRWTDTGRKVEVRDASFDGTLSRSVLEGDPDNLLQLWKTRLGFNIHSDGLLISGLSSPVRSSLLGDSDL